MFSRHFFCCSVSLFFQESKMLQLYLLVITFVWISGVSSQTIGVVWPVETSSEAGRLQSIFNNLASVYTAESIKFVLAYQGLNERIDLLQRVCGLITREQPSAVIGPKNTKDAAFIHPFLQSFDIPQFMPKVRCDVPGLQKRDGAVCLSLSHTAPWDILAGVFKKFAFQNFAIITTTYRSYGAASAFVSSYELRNVHLGPWLVEYRENNRDWEGKMTEIMHEIKDSGIRLIVVWCENEETCRAMLDLAKQTGTVGQEWALFLLGMHHMSNTLKTIDGSFQIISDQIDLIKEDLIFSKLSARLSYDLTDEETSLVGAAVEAIGALNSRNVAEKTEEFQKDSCLQRSPVSDSKWTDVSTCTLLSSSVITKCAQVNLTASNEYRLNVWNIQGGSPIKVGFGAPNQPLLWRSTTIRFSGRKLTHADRVTGVRGATLHVTTAVVEPFMRWKSGSTPLRNDLELRENIDVSGFLFTLLRKLSDELNFSYKLYLADRQPWGKPSDEELASNELTNLLRSKKTDLALYQFSQNVQAAESVDLTYPFHETAFAFVKNAHRQDIDNLLNFIKPMADSIWFYSLGSLAIATLMITLYNKASPFDHHGSWSLNLYHDMERTKQQRKLRKQFYREQKIAFREFSLGNSLFFAWASLLQQGYHTYPQSLSGRIVTSSWWCLILLLISSYTAQLTANLTSQELGSVVKTIDDLAGQGTLKYGTAENSSVEEYLTTSQVETYEKMKLFLRNKQLFFGLEAGLRKVRDESFAYLWDRETLSYFANLKPCDLEVSSDSFGSVPLSLALPKNSPYTRDISMAILQLREQGFIEQEFGKWKAQLEQCSDFLAFYREAEAKSKTGYKEMTFREIRGIFLVIYISFGVGGGILLIEWFVSCYKLASESRKGNQQERILNAYSGEVNGRRKSESKQPNRHPTNICSAFVYRIWRIRRDLVLNYTPDILRKQWLETTRSNWLRELLHMKRKIQLGQNLRNKTNRAASRHPAEAKIVEIGVEEFQQAPTKTGEAEPAKRSGMYGMFKE